MQIAAEKPAGLAERKPSKWCCEYVVFWFTLNRSVYPFIIDQCDIYIVFFLHPILLSTDKPTTDIAIRVIDRASGNRVGVKSIYLNATCCIRETLWCDSYDILKHSNIIMRTVCGAEDASRRS